MPLSRVQSEALSRKRGQRFPVAITFDDDLDSHARIAAPTLHRLGAPATFFLTGATLDGPSGFWWHRLDRALANGLGLDDEMLPDPGPASRRVAEWGGGPVDAVGEAIRTLAPPERKVLGDSLLAHAGPDDPDRGLTRGDVGRLVADGFELGFHTRDHDSLTLLGDEPLRDALVEGRGELEALYGRSLTSIAYPHGDADERVAAAAAAAGFTAGYTTAGGAVSAATDPLRQPRIDAGRSHWPRLGIDVLRAVLSR